MLAQYETLTLKKMLSRASRRIIAIPARYENITKRVKVSEERLEWRTILCETNTNPGIISEIQRALRSAGFNPGRIDGVYGSSTKNAVARYQQSKGLPTGGITLDTLRRLGVRHSTSRRT